MPVRSVFVRTLTLLLVAIAACAEGSTSPPPPAPPPPPPPPQGDVVVVNATGFASFVPDEITIDPGTRVRWVFVAGTPNHTITPRDAGQPGAWVRSLIDETNVSFDHVFNVAGQTYDYYCEPHEIAGMTGKVTVR